MIQRFFSLAHKAFPILALAVLFPVLTACEPSPDKALSQQAKSGDPAAQYELALAYSDLQQYEKAVHWWKQAAEQGHAPAPRHPAKNAECHQGSRPLRPVGMSSSAGLAAPYVREQGHLMIWPPEHLYRWAGGGCIG
ncbi:SEL1-like repeat protein [Pseudomonas sp. SGAir0191]|uniref:SEL1-like repeat protein n=1 Tax=Pseudomonas sp. SGAir0191 TaxID=2217867 RepID=UPI000C2CCF53|nr:SEL1-like repeat protein [Pseudomonas sp. SGAir0191]AUA34577.1 SEL1-like repeat protein [Pseudomonas sp. SGAir0191]